MKVDNAGAKLPFGNNVPDERRNFLIKPKGSQKEKRQRSLLRTSPSAMRKSGLSRLKKRRGISRFAGQSPKIGDTAFLCEAVPLQTKISPFGAFRGTNTAQAVERKL